MGLLAALREGVGLALSFNPVAALAGSAVAAMLLSRRVTLKGLLLAGAVVAAAWFLGDGNAWLAQARGVATGSDAASPDEWLSLLVWAVGSLGVGFVLPTWAGSFVGRRVTFGTGWASAAVVAGTISTALATIGGSLW